jgi:hypothetical protein
LSNVVAAIFFIDMATAIFKPGETREIRLPNGTKVTGFHSRMERRWERIRIYNNNGSFHAWYSRTTGLIDPNPEKSTILTEDPGFLNSYLTDKR